MVSQFPLTNHYVLLRDAVNQLLEESFVPSTGSRNGSSSPARSLPLDVYATPDELVILAAVPGMNPAELEITYSQNTVTLAGTIPSATATEEGKAGTWYVSELWHGQFRRSLSLPFEVDASKAEATFEHGIVRIVLPKAEWTKPQKISIRVANQRERAIESGKQQAATKA